MVPLLILALPVDPTSLASRSKNKGILDKAGMYDSNSAGIPARRAS